MESKKTRILILGGGFGGVFTALALNDALDSRSDLELAMVSDENYFVYTPMLAEVVSGNLSPLDIAVAIRDLSPKIRLYVRKVDKIDLDRKIVTTMDEFHADPQEIAYDHLVLGLGMVDNFSIIRGLADHGFHFKYIDDALILRHHIINILEHADQEKDDALRRSMLTFVVAGGGFSGIEVVGEMNDYVRAVAGTRLPHIDPSEIRMIVVEGGGRILPEFPQSLSVYALKQLKERKINILLNTRMAAVTANEAILDDGTVIAAKTVVATVGTAPNPVVSALPVKKKRGRLLVNRYLQVEGFEGVWAVGDCACLMDAKTGKPCPPTAQFAVRQGSLLGKNILASLDGTKKTAFSFSLLGMMGALGAYNAVGMIMGIKVSGLPAWILWRLVYWMKLPGATRKLQVAVDWIMAYFLPYDIVHFELKPGKQISRMHFEAKETVFKEGGFGDRVYVILEGEAEVVRKGKDREDYQVAVMKKGEIFGEMSLISETTHTATVRALTSLEVLTVERKAFKSLFDNVPLLRDSFEELVKKRIANDASIDDRRMAKENKKDTVPERRTKKSKKATQ